MIDQIDYSMMAFPKEAWKTKKRARQVKRKKHRKSIMHPKGSGAYKQRSERVIVQRCTGSIHDRVSKSELD